MSAVWAQNKIKRYKKRAVLASVLLSCGLFFMKVYASLTTGSLAVLSSLVDSLSDIVASVISFIAVRVSLKPATCSHRYGYFKAEHLSALIQAAFIAGSGVFVLYNGIDRILHPISLQQTRIGIVVMTISLIATICLIWFQQYVAKYTHSIAIKADSGHYIVDIITNILIIISLILVTFFKIDWFDTLTAVLIALYLFFYAYQIAKESVQALMDQELSDEIRESIFQIVKTVSDVRGIHDLRTRDLGGGYYFEMHIELEGSLSLSQAHEVTEQVEKKIKKIYQNAQVLIHQDPYGIKEDRLDDVLESCNY